MCKIIPAVSNGNTPLYPTIYFDYADNYTKNWNSSGAWF